MIVRRYSSARWVRGVLRRRLLVNAVVDPDEAAARLPICLRPHETPLGTVVGCCLLDIAERDLGHRCHPRSCADSRFA